MSSVPSRNISHISSAHIPATVWPWVHSLLMVYAKILLVMASITLFVTTTALLYGMLYWMVVPKRVHSYDVFFDYQANYSACAHVSLAAQQWEGLNRPITGWDRPTPGFEFDVTLELEYPPSQLLASPVMFNTELMNSERNTVVTTRRAMTVPTMSQFAQWARDLLTMGLVALHLFQDKLSTQVVLIDSVPIFEHETALVSSANICMQPPLHVFRATLHFESKLSGLRYLIANHPFLVGIAVVAAIAGLAVFGVLAAALVRFMRSAEPHEEDRDSASPVSAREEFIDGRSTDELGSGIRRRI